MHRYLEEERVKSRTLLRVSRTLSRRVLPALAIGTVVLAGTATGIRASHLAAAPQASRTGGSIAIRTIGPDDCLNSQVSTTNVTNQIGEGLMDPLITADQQGKPSPDLATSWKVTNGGKTVTFFLRQGVRFSNGDPFDASSVVWNYEHVLNPKTKSPNTGMLGPVKSVTAVNTYTVRLVLKAPFRPLFSGLAGTYLGMVDPRTTAKLGSKECSTVIGTGAFKLKSVGPAFNPIVMVRNPYHTWASPWQFNHGTAHLDQITFKPILSDSTAISELLTGGVQVSEIASTQLNRVQGNKNITIKRYADSGSYYLFYNFKHTPLDNANVRRAIAEGLDRGALVKAALDGIGKQSFSVMASRIPDYDPNASKSAPPYNPADARTLLKGVKLPTLTLVTFNDPTSTLAGELIQAELSQIGITAKVEPHAVADALNLLGSGSFDLFLGDYTYDDPDILYLLCGPQAPGWYYTNPTFNKYLITGRESTNPAVVRGNYIAAQEFINKNTLVDPLFTPLDMFGINKRVKGWHVNFFTLGYTVEPVLQDLWVSK
jgi:peptide/nickel transport system substrate-binding protein